MNAALAATYANAGVAVFPCREAGALAKSPYIKKGYHNASASMSSLGCWASMHPNALYGLPCNPNGLLVLDADRHGQGDGVASLLSLFGHYGFDWRLAPFVRTPRNGLHIIFARPVEFGKAKGKLTDAIDIKDNGYIIAPGNVLPDGRAYHLLNGSIEQLAHCIATSTLLEVPDWLKPLIIMPPKPIRKPFNYKPNAQQCANSVTGIIRTVINTGEGNRNRVLFWASCRIGELAQQGAIDEQAALALLAEAGTQAGLSAHEAHATAKSGMRTATTGECYAC